MCRAFAIHLMRRQMRRSLHSTRDCLLAKAGVERSGIDAFVVELFLHDRKPLPSSAGLHVQRRRLPIRRNNP
jgi:hypothetical protein